MTLAADSLETFSGSSDLGDCHDLDLDETFTLEMERVGDDGWAASYVDLVFASGLVSILQPNPLIILET